MADSGEFAEFETDQVTFDAMLEQAEPAELVGPPTCVTVLSAARDTVTFRRGLPLSVDNTASTAVGWPIQRSPIRPYPIHQTQPMDGMAG